MPLRGPRTPHLVPWDPRSLRAAYRGPGGGGGLVAEGFTCAVAKHYRKNYRSACEQLDFYGEYEGKRYCVLHYPGEEKKDDFRKVIESKLAQKDYDFSGTIFPEGTSDFSRFVFDGNADFTGATFVGKADFRD